MSADRAAARIDLGAIRHNAALLARAAGGARLMAVVKADGYGHGAVPAARAALEGGASALAVAAAAEAHELRDAGIDAPVLMMGPLAGRGLGGRRGGGRRVDAWTPEVGGSRGRGVGGGRGAGAGPPKLDTGMGRLGARPEDVDALAEPPRRRGRGIASSGS